jgi:hypothetical protein
MVALRSGEGGWSSFPIGRGEDNAMLETDDASIIPRARAYGNDRWREVRGLPAAPAAVAADLTDAQRKSFRCLVGIIDTPLTGNEQSDFLLRRNQVEACRVILQLRPTPLPTTFPMPRLESVADAVSAHAAVIEAVREACAS